MSIKGYNVFRADRKLRTRGGVALYTHSLKKQDSKPKLKKGYLRKETLKKKLVT